MLIFLSILRNRFQKDWNTFLKISNCGYQNLKLVEVCRIQFFIGYRKRSRIHYRKSVSFRTHWGILLSSTFSPKYSRYVPVLTSPCIESRTSDAVPLDSASRPSQASIIWHLSLRQLCPIVSFPFPLGLILTPLIAGTQWDITAGGESIFTRPEIDRPRNESPRWGGRERTATSSRRAPSSSMKLSHPINLFASATTHLRISPAHVK